MKKEGKVPEYGKMGQVTLFIIIGIILLVSIAAIVFVFREKILLQKPVAITLESTMEKCIKDSVQEAVEKIIPNGGFLQPEDYLFFNNTYKRVAFLCYTEEYEELCTNNHPILIEEAEEEIKKDIKDKIESCFDSAEKNIRKSYSYAGTALSLDVEIVPSQVKVIARKNIIITKGHTTETFENFDAGINSALYKFISLSNQIINEEVSCDCKKETCNADLSRINQNNQEFEITKPVYTGRGEEVYVIKEISSDLKFNFAIRNCVRRVPGI